MLLWQYMSHPNYPIMAQLLNLRTSLQKKLCGFKISLYCIGLKVYLEYLVKSVVCIVKIDLCHILYVSIFEVPHNTLHVYLYLFTATNIQIQL